MLLRPLRFFKKVFPDVVWDLPAEKNEVYLTFDDGPTPQITPWLLDLLDEYGAKATFFCLARNAERHPEIYQEILRRGHVVGNHTYSHLKGSKVSLREYVEDVELASQLTPSGLFRPPYARISPKQLKAVSGTYKIVMWSILSRDYSRWIDGPGCIGNVLPHIYPGAVVVFHDSLKSAENLKFALPVILKELKNKGYTLKSINL